MGCALEDVFVALNAADWQAQPIDTVPAAHKNRSSSRRLQLRAQVQELLDLYSLQRLFGAQSAQAGMLMDALCLAVKQLLSLSGCWLVNGSVVMGSSQTRTGQSELILPDIEAGTLPPDHTAWKALKQQGPGFGYAVRCPLFRQSGGLLLIRSENPLPDELLAGFAQVLSASVQLQHHLWRIEDGLEQANEATLQHYRTELTEWVLILIEHQQALIKVLSDFVCHRHGLEARHPLRVADLASSLSKALNWPDDLTEAMYVAGFQVALEGVQWSSLLQDGSRSWVATDQQKAELQSQVSWLMLSQFFPLVDWPAQEWHKDSEPYRLLSLVREYCALTEKRRYRKRSTRTQCHAQALHKLTDDQSPWPKEWTRLLQEITKEEAG